MTDQNTQEITNWLDEESKSTGHSGEEFEKLPTLKLESGKVTKFNVDFSQPFKKWTKTENGTTTTKAIIPVTHKTERKNIWLNVKNPLYSQLIEAGKKGVTEFRVSTTGLQNNTRYQLVEEE